MDLNRKEIKISSGSLNLYKVELFVKEIFDYLELRTELFNKVLLCVNEAVVNSISHGNRFDQNKIVIIQSFFCNEYLYFRIVDEGEGFDYHDLADPTAYENIFKETGRGIFIIKNISDEITFREKGKVIEFKIKLNGKS
jgi:serine/threonine-protein kinase RsbW